MPFYCTNNQTTSTNSMTSIITFRDRQNNNPGFYTTINIGTPIHQTTLQARLDTGAARTIISVGALSDKYSIHGSTSKEREKSAREQQIKIDRMFAKYDAYTTRLISSSGQKMRVIAVEAHDVVINVIKLSNTIAYIYSDHTTFLQKKVPEKGIFTLEVWKFRTKNRAFS